jgi:hypothetical protein
MPRSTRWLLIANTVFETLVAVGSVVAGLLMNPVGVTQLVLAGNAAISAGFNPAMLAHALFAGLFRVALRSTPA